MPLTSSSEVYLLLNQTWHIQRSGPHSGNSHTTYCGMEIYPAAMMAGAQGHVETICHECQHRLRIEEDTADAILYAALCGKKGDS